MANRIKGITVEIGGDTTKLSKALESVNKNIKSTQTQLKDVEKLLKLDPKNTELLSQKQKLLADSISATKEKLTTLKTAAEQANTALANGEISQEAIWLENEKITAETAAAALPDKTQKYLIYCHSGMRAEQAKKKLRDLGYTDVENFGGVINWPYGLTK